MQINLENPWIHCIRIGSWQFVAYVLHELFVGIVYYAKF